SSPQEVSRAAAAAAAALDGWRRTPVTERVQYIFRLKARLEDRLEDFAAAITAEHGKVLAEARGEVRRAIDNLDMACGAPSLMQGDASEDVSRGIDEVMIRQPVGVCAAIVPFNFPLMIPCWFLPSALVTGNTFVLKASERTPLTAQLLFQELEGLGLPDGVVNLLHGGVDTANALIDHPAVRAVSFVGSTPAARAVYARATSLGKRAQAQGGARNAIVVLPDAALDLAADVTAESAFGNAGQRCLAGGLAIAVGNVGKDFTEAVVDLAQSRVVGPGAAAGSQIGPVISGQSRSRIEDLVTMAHRDGATLAVDGRAAVVDGYGDGFYVRPTVITGVAAEATIAKTEVFGPVLTVLEATDLDQALRMVNGGDFGNMACVFTESGRAARRFRYEAQAGNIGINVGVAQPMPFFPFSGWKDSFFGDLHAHGRHGIEFYTQTKVVVERWQ
ncbi:MAG: malonate-semialdehyde dehydrogenase (acetylating) / methylmalonate-semialdehyde dehydrogenase, partial [Frankiales bacterium]|nr:malonate-semialdehyde dehydrogenase (acetylating) / methylmalonate-semialdehyde dehydrogenase [Frankiales bacterium]